MGSHSFANFPLDVLGLDENDYGVVCEDVGPLCEGEEMVLGQLQSQKAAKLRRAAEEQWWDDREEALKGGSEPRPWAELLLSEEISDEFRTIVVSSLRSLLGLREGSEYMDALPADVECISDLRLRKVPASDRREGLRGAMMAFPCGQLTVLAAPHGIPAGTVLGPYRARTMLASETPEAGDRCPSQLRGSLRDGLNRRLASLTDMDALTQEWRLLHHRYGLDYTAFQRYQADRGEIARLVRRSPELLGPVFGHAGGGPLPAGVLENFELTASAAGIGNILARVNDPAVVRGRGYVKGSVRAKDENVDLWEILIRGWPYPFFVATRDIRAGEEIAYSYGEAYWSEAADKAGELERILQVIGAEKVQRAAAEVLREHDEGTALQ